MEGLPDVAFFYQLADGSPEDEYEEELGAPDPGYAARACGHWEVDCEVVGLENAESIRHAPAGGDEEGAG